MNYEAWTAAAAFGALIVSLIALYFAIRSTYAAEASSQAASDSAEAAKDAVVQAKRQADAAHGNVEPFLDLFSFENEGVGVSVAVKNPNNRSLNIHSVSLNPPLGAAVWFFKKGTPIAELQKDGDIWIWSLPSPERCYGGSIESPGSSYFRFVFITADEERFAETLDAQHSLRPIMVTVEYSFAGGGARYCAVGNAEVPSLDFLQRG